MRNGVVLAWPCVAAPELIVEADGTKCHAALLGVDHPSLLSEAASAALCAAFEWGARPGDTPPDGWHPYVLAAECLH